MSELVKIDAPELGAIEKSKAEQIKKTFDPMVKMLSEFEESFNLVIKEKESGVTKELTLKAKRLRIDIGKVRIATGKLKDEQKAEYLRAGNAIQAVHNLLVWAVTDKENKLKEIEDHFEILEKNRLEELQMSRAEKLAPYVDDAYERNLSSMEEDVWNAYFQTKKKEHDDRIEAEKKAEKERIEREKAEAAERQRIQKENERLKKEAEERDRLAKIEKDKREKEEQERIKQQEAERKAREEKERKDRAEYEAKIKAEREERERFEREERAKREKIEAELKARQEAERKAKEQEEARIQNELSKGDQAKISDLISDLNLVKSKYTFKSKVNQKMYSDVCLLVDKVINHINERKS